MTVLHLGVAYRVEATSDGLEAWDEDGPHGPYVDMADLRQRLPRDVEAMRRNMVD